MQPNMPQATGNFAAMQAMNINELMTATLRMSDLLQEESMIFRERRYKELPKLQEEKMKLTTLLERYQHRLSADPTFIKQADPASREELLLLTDDLAYAVEENFRDVSTARAVNSRVMQAFRDVMSDQHRPGTYGRDGVANHANDMALSMNLNQRA